MWIAPPNDTADDKTRNPRIPGGIYSRFYVIATSNCTSWMGVPCRLLNQELSMDKSTVLGFSDTSGDYKELVEPHTRGRRCRDCRW